MENTSPVPAKGRKIDVLVSFTSAIESLIGGAKIRRQEWTDGDEFCLLKDNFLMIYRGGKFHTWTVSEGDLLAIDWKII